MQKRDGYYGLDVWIKPDWDDLAPNIGEWEIDKREEFILEHVTSALLAVGLDVYHVSGKEYPDPDYS